MELNRLDVPGAPQKIVDRSVTLPAGDLGFGFGVA
jgi:hypothetical protein